MCVNFLHIPGFISLSSGTICLFSLIGFFFTFPFNFKKSFVNDWQLPINRKKTQYDGGEDVVDKKK